MSKVGEKEYPLNFRELLSRKSDVSFGKIITGIRYNYKKLGQSGSLETTTKAWKEDPDNQMVIFDAPPKLPLEEPEEVEELQPVAK